MKEESERIKNKVFKECINRLKDTFSDDVLEEFVIAFMTATDGYLFKRKEC